PIPAACTELGDFFEHVCESVEEKAQPGAETIDRHTSVDTGLGIGDTIGQGESHFLSGRRSRFTYVIAAYADGIPPWNIFLAKLDQVDSQPHRLLGRINILASADDLL